MLIGGLMKSTGWIKPKRFIYEFWKPMLLAGSLVLCALAIIFAQVYLKGLVVIGVIVLLLIAFRYHYRSEWWSVTKQIDVGYDDAVTMIEEGLEKRHVVFEKVERRSRVVFKIKKQDTYIIVIPNHWTNVSVGPSLKEKEVTLEGLLDFVDEVFKTEKRTHGK